MLSRRQFLRTSSIVSLTPVVPTLLASTAQAAGTASDAKTLVVIQLDGGNDGLNTVVPFADDGYARARNKLRLETSKLHKLNEYVGLHPRMGAAKSLFDDGRLSILQGVGYPNPDRSHFRSMKIWQTARFREAEQTSYGWLGRALDIGQSERQSAKQTAPGAIYVGDSETPIALWGRRSTATAFSQATDLHLAHHLAHPLAMKPSSPAVINAANKESSALTPFVSQQVLSAYQAADEFQKQQPAAPSEASYPDTKLGERLKLVSQMLKSGSQTRVYYTSQSGYDTHSAQIYTHARLLRAFSEALQAFLNDLKAAKLDDRVVVLAFSEFGRRVKENDSQGTDHGTSGPVFLAGSSLVSGLQGTAPDLSQLEEGDLPMKTDFRQVYATLLEDWLGIRSQEVLHGDFEKLPLFKG